MEELKQGRAVSDKTAAALALAHTDKEITCAHPATTASYSHPMWTISEPSTLRGALRTPLKAGYPPVQPVVPGHGPRAGTVFPVYRDTAGHVPMGCQECGRDGAGANLAPKSQTIL